jgi:hypothetical protein
MSEAGVEPARHRGLPSPSLTLIFTLEDPLVLTAHPDPAQPPGIYETIVGGLHTRPAIITHDGRQSGIQLGLSPLGARALLGVPAGELAERDLRADDVLGPLTNEIQDRLRCASNWSERFAILEAGRGVPKLPSHSCLGATKALLVANQATLSLALSSRITT